MKIASTIGTTSCIETLHGSRTDKQPGHWLLASLGKRVLRPGGLELTQRLLKELNPAVNDRIVELAPGLGVTAQSVLKVKPLSYTGIERDAKAADRLRDRLVAPGVQIQTASAE